MLKALGGSQDFVAKEYILSLRDYALSKGVTTETLLLNTQKDADFLLNPPKYVSETILHTMGKNLSMALGDVMLAAIEFGQTMTLASHGVLGMAIQGCHTLQDTTHLAHRYAQTRASSRSLNIVTEADGLCIRYDKTTSHSAQKYDDHFFSKFTTLINIEVLVRQLLQQHAITHSPHSQECQLHIPFKSYPHFPHDKIQEGLCVKFNCDYLQLKIPLAWMPLSLREGDKALAEMATNECEKDLKLHSPKDIANEIYKQLEQKDNYTMSLVELAQSLSISVSTLQRRLREVNNTFKDIKAEARLNKAKLLLKHSPQSIENIACTLGFSDASNFTKSFKGRVGLTPKDYRKENMSN